MGISRIKLVCESSHNKAQQHAVVQIGAQSLGRVLASMDTSEFLPGEDCWAYLGTGIMVDTDFGGLVHYTEETADDFVLVKRGAAAS